MTDLYLKRKSRDLRHLEQRLSFGPGHFLFRHESIIRPLLKYALKGLGPYKRGERNALQPIVRRMRLPFDSLPSGFCGFRILQLSDLHIDGIRGLAERVVGQIATLEVDLCVLTGDYRFANSGPCHNVISEMRKIVRAIRSRYGIFGILGNHDYMEEASALESMGVRMLMNAAVEIARPEGSIWVAGVDDAWDYECSDLPRALAGLPPAAFKVLLAHCPDTIMEAAEAGVHMYLCGHTHAGQIRLPWIGAAMVPANCERRFIQGRWKQGAMEGYTSSGIGCSLLPVRFRCPPEIGWIELRCSRHAYGESCCASIASRAAAQSEENVGAGLQRADNH